MNVEIGVLYSSSAELVKERYAVQAIPITDTKGCEGSVICAHSPVNFESTYNLELDRYDPEV